MATKKKGRPRKTDDQLREKLAQIAADLLEIRKTPYNKRTAATLRREYSLMEYTYRLNKRIATGKW